MQNNKGFKFALERKTIPLKRNRIYLAAGILLLLCTVVYLAACAPTVKRRKFVRKDCLDCHQPFADKYFKMKSVHPVTRDKQCEKCHLRHGIVPRLIFKEQGNQMCYTCHEKEKIGLDKSVVHTALKKEKCISCHNPHASQANHLLGAEGSEFCYQCHKKDSYEKKVVHKVLIEKPCDTCHLPHSSDEANLLKTNDIAFVCPVTKVMRQPSKKHMQVIRWRPRPVTAAIIPTRHHSPSF